jgi:hypothetical protein
MRALPARIGHIRPRAGPLLPFDGAPTCAAFQRRLTRSRVIPKYNPYSVMFRRPEQAIGECCCVQLSPADSREFALRMINHVLQ